MKRILATAAVAMLIAAPAFAAGTTIKNNSGLPIDELFSATPGSKDWGKNILDGVPEGALDNGKSVEVANLADGTYDLRVSAPDEGVLCYMSGISVKDHVVELTEQNGKDCQ